MPFIGNRYIRPRKPQFPTWTDDPVADAERYYAYLDEVAEYNEEDEYNPYEDRREE